MATFRRSKSGVTRIIRDTYKKKQVPKLLQPVVETWWSLCKKVRQRDRHKCVKCGAPENPKEKIWHDVHHIIELSRGGRTVLSNLILLCKKCHKKRHKHL